MGEVFMTNEERDIQRKFRVLQPTKEIGNAQKACQYFGIGQSSLEVTTTRFSNGWFVFVSAPRGSRQPSDYRPKQRQ
jgi:hypothetical protein